MAVFLLCKTPRGNGKKRDEAETENTQSYGEACAHHRLRQVRAPQSGHQPPAPQQVVSFYPLGGQDVSPGNRRYSPPETSAPLFLLIVEEFRIKKGTYYAEGKTWRTCSQEA